MLGARTLLEEQKKTGVSGGQPNLHIMAIVVPPGIFHLSSDAIRMSWHPSFDHFDDNFFPSLMQPICPDGTLQPPLVTHQPPLIPSNRRQLPANRRQLPADHRRLPSTFFSSKNPIKNDLFGAACPIHGAQPLLSLPYGVIRLKSGPFSETLTRRAGTTSPGGRVYEFERPDSNVYQRL